MNILAIDFSAMFRRNWEATGGKELSAAYDRTLQTVAAIRDGYDRVAILCDSGTSFRKSLLPTYKANRERPPAPFYEQQERTILRLEKDGCSAFAAPVVGESNGQAYCAEADDLAWAIAQWCKSNGHALTIYGGDKDLLQCVDDNAGIYVVRPDYDGIWHAARVTEKYGVPPHLIADLLALGGDTSDEFKMFPGWTDEAGNHPGIGLGHASKLLQRFGNIIGVIDAIEGMDPNTQAPMMKDGAIKEALRRGKPTPIDAARLGLSIATLRCPPELVDFTPLVAEPVWAPLTRTDAGQPAAPSGIPLEGERSEDGGRCAIPSPPPPARATATDCLRVPDVEAEPVPRAQTATAPRALARIEAHSTAIDTLALQPRTWSAMKEAAEELYESRLYPQYPNASAILAVGVEATERGVSLGIALRNAYIVKGKPAWSAAFLAALIRRDPRCKIFRIIESTTDRAVLEYQRSDEEGPSLFEFTIEEARAAGWLRSSDKGDSKWITNPRTMLRWAAMREAGRAFFYDITAGIDTLDDENFGG